MANRAQKKRPWITREVIKAKRVKHKAWKKMKALIRPELKEEEINLKGNQTKLWEKYVEKRNRAN